MTNKVSEAVFAEMQRVGPMVDARCGKELSISMFKLLGDLRDIQEDLLKNLERCAAGERLFASDVSFDTLNALESAINAALGDHQQMIKSCVQATEH